MYVPTATDLYLRGNNILNWYSADGVKFTFEAGGIQCSRITNERITSRGSYNFSGRSKIFVEMMCNKYERSVVSDSSTFPVAFQLFKGSDTTAISRTDVSIPFNGTTVTISTPVAPFSSTITLKIENPYRWSGWIYRIYVS